MKKLLSLLAALAIAAPLFAQLSRIEPQFASGSWGYSGLRLMQSDANAKLAKANIKLPQKGMMDFEFTARYEGGAEDGHGGFGIHIFADSAYPKASWGSGRSYLLWLNYDEKPVSASIPKGFSAQVYRSTAHYDMTLLHSVDLNEFRSLITPESLSQALPIHIQVDGDSGTVKIFNPLDPTNYFSFTVDKKDIPMKGSWIALRTNGMKVSFGM